MMAPGTQANSQMVFTEAYHPACLTGSLFFSR
jgi:hypothetical protein